MPREGFYRADQGKALSCRPCPGPHPGSQKVEMTHTQFAELDKHNYLLQSVNAYQWLEPWVAGTGPHDAERSGSRMATGHSLCRFYDRLDLSGADCTF